MSAYFLNHIFFFLFLFLSLFFVLFIPLIKYKYNKIRLFFLFVSAVFAALALLEIYLSFFMDTVTKIMSPFDTLGVSISKKNISDKKTDKFIKTISKNNKEHYYFNVDIVNNIDRNKEFIVFNTDITHYSNGFRYTKSNVLSDESIIFLGCSRIHGDGLNDDETIPYYFSKKLNFEKFVLNASVPARSTNTAISILNSDVINKFMAKKRINFFLYLLVKDHIYRNFRNTYSDMVGDNKIYKNKKSIEVSQSFGKIKKLFAKSYIFRRTFLILIDKYNDNFYKNYLIDSIEYMNNIIKTKYSSKLVLIVWNEFDEDFINKLKEKCGYIIVLPRYFDENDEIYKIKGDETHLTSKANEEISEILYNYLKENNFLR